MTTTTRNTMLALGLFLAFLYIGVSYVQKANFRRTVMAMNANRQWDSEPKATPQPAKVVLSVQGELTTLNLQAGDSAHVIVGEQNQFIRVDEYLQGMKDPITFQPKQEVPDVGSIE